MVININEEKALVPNDRVYIRYKLWDRNTSYRELLLYTFVGSKLVFQVVHLFFIGVINSVLYLKYLKIRLCMRNIKKSINLVFCTLVCP